MSNHAVGAGFTPAQNTNRQIEPRQTYPDNPGQPQGIAPTGAIGNIAGAYKSLVANKCLEIYKQKWMEFDNGTKAGSRPSPMMGKLRQHNYYEHIIRNESFYQTIAHFIINNPAKWNTDKFFLS